MSKILSAIFGKREKVIFSGIWGSCVLVGQKYYVELFGTVSEFQRFDDAYSFLQGLQ